MDTHLTDATQVCNEINGLEIASNSRVTGLTNFVNEACSDLIFSGARPVKLQEYQSDTLETMDLNAYFARPRRLSYGDYVPIDRVPLYDDYLLSMMNTEWARSRLKGCYGWRGTMCYKLVVTATPFQAGILRLAYNCDEDIPERRTLHVSPVSVLPGVELDISKSTSVVMKVPYTSQFNFVPLADNQKEPGGNLGRVVVFPVTPAQLPPSGNAPGFTVWGWVEDLELIGGATSDYLVAQAGKFEKNASSREADNIPGNISNVLSAGSNLATFLGRRIPLISSFAGPASWMLRESAKIAASYGWSKPLDSKPTVKNLFTDNISQQNCDTAFTGYNLGFFADNSVVPCPGFAGTDVDEMSLEYILGVSSVLALPTFSKSNAIGDTIYSCSLSPYSMRWSDTNKNTSAGPIDTWAPFWVSPIYGVAQTFASFRGGFRFRLKLAKTGFHTGRLLVGFNPVNGGNSWETRVPVLRAPTDPAVSPVPFKSVIWDLRDDSVLDFECPFQSPYSYLNTSETYGDFFVKVLDKLEAPDTVSDTIMMVVEVSAMPGFEFAIPSTPNVGLIPFIPQPPSANVIDDIMAQSGEFVPTVETGTNLASSLCIGERILSIKQLLLRSVPYGILKGGASMNVNNYCTRPVKTAGDGNYKDDIRDYINWYGSAYAYKRGGIAISAIAMGTSTTLSTAKLDTDDSFDMAPLIVEKRGALHLKVPYYNKLSRIHTTTHGLTRESGNCWTTLYSAGKTTDPPAIVFRSAADDFQFGGFIGFPQMVAVSGGYTNNSLALKKVLVGVPP